MNEQLNQWILDRERELEKKRTVALARQQWVTVVECEAKQDELKLWRKKISDFAEGKVI